MSRPPIEHLELGAVLASVETRPAVPGATMLPVLLRLWLVPLRLSGVPPPEVGGRGFFPVYPRRPLVGRPEEGVDGGMGRLPDGVLGIM